MSLERHGCKLQLEWLVEVHNCEAVFIVSVLFPSIKYTGRRVKLICEPVVECAHLCDLSDVG